MAERQTKRDEQQAGGWLAEQLRRLRAALADLVNGGGAVGRPVPVPVPVRVPSGRRRYY